MFLWGRSLTARCFIPREQFVGVVADRPLFYSA